MPKSKDQIRKIAEALYSGIKMRNEAEAIKLIEEVLNLIREDGIEVGMETTDA